MTEDIRTSNGARIGRSVLVPLAGFPAGVAIMSINTCYAHPAGRDMVQTYSPLIGSDTSSEVFARRSADNGISWSAAETLFTPREVPQGVLRWGESCLFLDESRDRILQALNESIYPKGMFSGDMWRYTRIAYRVSRDGGRSFPEPRPLVCQGGDAEDWMAGVRYGENGAGISFCAPIRLRDGRILLPCQKVPRGSDFQRPFSISWEAGFLLGSWRGEDLEWEAGPFLAVGPDRSTRGLCEPTLAELPDGTLFMVCRASNSAESPIQGFKWCSLLATGAKAWSEPFPLSYGDGTPVFSPATGSRLIRHSRTGRLHWIGNIVPGNPDGNRPRYPLQMVEVDEGRWTLRRESLVVIDEKRPEDHPLVQLSNFRVLEDRESGEILVYLARVQERGEKDLSSPAYRYRVRLP